MNNYQNALKVLGVCIFAVSLIHVLFGASSEVILGSGISDTSMLDPSLDSQNRFYGAAFALYGGVFWLCSTNLALYTDLLKLALTVFFLAGASRVLSIVFIGWPSPEILMLTAVELLGPLIMYLWLKRVCT
jgi:uncharacterized protein DUF4345